MKYEFIRFKSGEYYNVLRIEDIIYTSEDDGIFEVVYAGINGLSILRYDKKVKLPDYFHRVEQVVNNKTRVYYLNQSKIMEYSYDLDVLEIFMHLLDAPLVLNLNIDCNRDILCELSATVCN